MGPFCLLSQGILLSAEYVTIVFENVISRNVFTSPPTHILLQLGLFWSISVRSFSHSLRKENFSISSVWHTSLKHIHNPTYFCGLRSRSAYNSPTRMTSLSWRRAWTEHPGSPSEGIHTVTSIRGTCCPSLSQCPHTQGRTRKSEKQEVKLVHEINHELRVSIETGANLILGKLSFLVWRRA